MLTEQAILLQEQKRNVGTCLSFGRVQILLTNGLQMFEPGQNYVLGSAVQTEGGIYPAKIRLNLGI